MLNSLKQHWIQLKRFPPGQRFCRRHDEQREAGRPARHILHRALVWGLAVVLLLIGIVLMFMPGPAILFFLLAGAVMAEESRTVARFLDWLELRLRQVGRRFLHWWKTRSSGTRVSLAVLTVAIVTTGAYGSYLALFN